MVKESERKTQRVISRIILERTAAIYKPGNLPRRIFYNVEPCRRPVSRRAVCETLSKNHLKISFHSACWKRRSGSRRQRSELDYLHNRIGNRSVISRRQAGKMILHRGSGNPMNCRYGVSSYKLKKVRRNRTSGVSCIKKLCRNVRHRVTRTENASASYGLSTLFMYVKWRQCRLY